MSFAVVRTENGAANGGGGPEAGNLAGRMRQQGKMWILWPRGEALPKGEAAAPRYD